jgi:hypothetical protein
MPLIRPPLPCPSCELLSRRDLGARGLHAQRLLGCPRGAEARAKAARRGFAAACRALRLLHPRRSAVLPLPALRSRRSSLPVGTLTCDKGQAVVRTQSSFCIRSAGATDANGRCSTLTQVGLHDGWRRDLAGLQRSAPLFASQPSGAEAEAQVGCLRSAERERYLSLTWNQPLESLEQRYGRRMMLRRTSSRSEQEGPQAREPLGPSTWEWELPEAPDYAVTEGSESDGDGSPDVRRRRRDERLASRRSRRSVRSSCTCARPQAHR